MEFSSFGSQCSGLEHFPLQYTSLNLGSVVLKPFGLRENAVMLGGQGERRELVGNGTQARAER